MDDPKPRWRELYECALLELEREKLLQYIELAEQAISEQVNQTADSLPHNQYELDAMQDALRALRVLRRNALRK